MLINLPNAFGDAATNMAIDTALLESIPDGLAAFRHYAWLEPAATFGYAQTIDSVRQTMGTDLKLCRRLTGGGIVDHRNDWTYALVLHNNLPPAKAPATELYQKIHDAIRLALKEMDIESQLAPCPRRCQQIRTPSLLPSQCFVSPAANDVLRPDGGKIAGAAMKRTRRGLLIQGSIDRGALPDNFDFHSLVEQLPRQFSATLKLQPGSLEDIRPLFNSASIEREKLRFKSQKWNEKR